MSSKELNLKCRVGGDGFWSTWVGEVEGNLTVKSHGWDDDGCGYATFHLVDWDAPSQGLIYTDTVFMESLRAELSRVGLPSEGIDYSEQGMQPADGVHFDASEAFITAVQAAGYGE